MLSYQAICKTGKTMAVDVTTCREGQLLEKVVFVDGFPGCGKTLFSPIIASLERVELLTFSNELEFTCALHYLNKLPLDAAITMVRMQMDLKVYNTMMGRDVNFRISDQSSAIQDHDPSRYFQRLFEAGNETIPDTINKKKPILNIATHQLLSASKPIWRGLGKKCIFIEVVRHPLYMFRQQLRNEESLFGSARDFTLTFLYDGRQVPYYTLGWEQEYLDSNKTERLVNYFKHLTKRTEDAKKNIGNSTKVITIPFEKFVLEPNSWVEKIAFELDTEIGKSTKDIMKKQNVPRSKVSQSIDTPIYRRCGWVPPIEGASERDELVVRRDEIKQSASIEVMKTMDSLCDVYEDKYWSPDNE